MAEARGARLFVLAGPDLARSFPLGERATLGRSDECDVVLRDRSISRKHAVLERRGENWVLEDLGSTNGISKDGKRSPSLTLADGDEFKLGDLPLRIRLDAALPAPDHTEPQDIEFDLSPASAPPAAARPSAPAPAPPRAAGAALDDVELEESVAIEGLDAEIEIEGPDAPAAPARAPLAATTFRAPRSARRTGFFTSDLEQQPFWLRTLVVLLLLALCAGLAYGAYHGVRLLRAGL